MEIVSRDSRHRDYFEKKQLYQEAGTLEYWIVDPLQNRVEFYRLVEGRYELVPLEHQSDLPFGCAGRLLAGCGVAARRSSTPGLREAPGDPEELWEK